METILRNLHECDKHIEIYQRWYGAIEIRFENNKWEVKNKENDPMENILRFLHECDPYIRQYQRQGVIVIRFENSEWKVTLHEGMRV